MSGAEFYLPLVWIGVLGVAVVMYVLLDGFDLGIGVLFPFTRDEHQRDIMMGTVAPFWDGNETWLVLGGAGLFVAFPPAYGIIMPAFYLPVIVMLLALVIRGVAFEFHVVGESHKGQWHTAFFLGSTLAAFCQGVILGGLIQGVRVENGEYAGGAFDWATPFALLCGAGIVAGYALLGATWLVLKTEGEIAARARAQAKVLILVVMAFMAAVSAWTPLALPRLAERWFSTPNIFYLWPVPLATAALALAAWRWLDRGREALPFLAAMGLFLLGFFGLAISAFPYAVPYALTVWQAAAAPSSQAFMLVGTLFLLPLILGYVAFVYWLFRGKVTEGYH